MPNLRRKLTNKPLIYFLFFVFFILGLFVFFNTNLLKVSEVRFKSDLKRCTNTNSIEGFLDLKGKNIILIDESIIISKVKQKFSCLDNLTIKKIYPDKLEISLHERVPEMIVTFATEKEKKLELDLPEASAASSTAGLFRFDIEIATESGRVLVDKSGFIISSLGNELSEFAGLPRVYLVNFGKQAFIIENSIIPKTLTIIKSINFSFNTLTVKEDMLFVSGEQNVVLSLSKEINRQLASLQLILQKATIDLKPIEFIDLRFDKPVVIYSPKKKN